MRLLEILKHHSATLQSSGQIVMQCAFPENHSTESQSRKQMYLSPDINAYHCFSCGAKGKLTSLLAVKFDVPYFEALEMVRIDTYEKEKKADLSKDEYYWNLTNPPEFIARNYTIETLKKFKVGIGEKGETVIHMYWDGILKGLKFRINEPKRKFWYSLSFNKEEYLYNGDACYKDYVILVEGETDVWRLLEWGYQSYGTLGTSLSDWQVGYIAKTKKVYIASDTDTAGIKAAHRWYNQLSKFTDVEFLNYPAKDVGECSFRGFKYAFKNPCNYGEFLYLTS